MKRFRYRARRSPGELEEGVLAAESPEAASRVLTDRGLYPVELAPVGDEGKPKRTGLRPWSRSGWSVTDRALFARQLADLLTGGLTVDGALAVLVEQSRTPTLRARLDDLHAAVREGEPLSGALEAQTGGLRERGTLVSAVRAGEASGALPEVLDSVAELLEQEAAILRKVREALTYPALVAVVAFATLIVLFTFVVPRVTLLYEDLEQVLPLPTRILLGASRLTVAAGLPAVLVLALATGLFVRELGRSERLQLAWGRALLRVPVVGRILFLRETVRFSRILGTLVGGGVPLLDSLGHAAGALGNAHFRSEVRELRREIHEGRRLSEAMRARDSFRGPLTAMVRVGEESGDLAHALGKAGLLHERELDGLLRRATALLEPLLIVGLGLVVAFVVFAMMLPILQIDLGVG